MEVPSVPRLSIHDGRHDIASLEEAEMLKRCLELESNWEQINKERREANPSGTSQETKKSRRTPSWVYPPLDQEFVDDGAMLAPGMSIDEVVRRKYKANLEPSNSEAMTEAQRAFRINELKDAQSILSSEIEPLLEMIWKEKERRSTNDSLEERSKLVPNMQSEFKARMEKTL